MKQFVLIFFLIFLTSSVASGNLDSLDQRLNEIYRKTKKNTSITEKNIYRKDCITKKDKAELVDYLVSLILSSAHAKCSVEYERDRVKLRSKFQTEEDIKVLASFAFGWAITYIDSATLSTAYTAFTLAKSAAEEDKTGFVISVIAMAAPYLWRTTPGWGNLLLHSTTRAVLGGTLAAMNGFVAVKSKENMEISQKRSDMIEKTKKVFDESIKDDGSFDLCPEEGTESESESVETYQKNAKKWYISFFNAVFPSALAAVKPVGMMGQGCVTQRFDQDTKCECSARGNCFNVIPEQYYRTKLPASLRESFNYLSMQMNKINNGTLNIDNLDMSEIKRQKEFLLKASKFLLKEVNKERVKKGMQPADLDLSEEGYKDFLRKRILNSIPQNVQDNWSKQKNEIGKSFYNKNKERLKSSKKSLSDIYFSLDNSLESVDNTSKPNITKDLKHGTDQGDSPDFKIDYPIHKDKNRSIFSIISNRYLQHMRELGVRVNSFKEDNDE